MLFLYLADSVGYMQLENLPVCPFFNHHKAVAEDSLALGAKPIGGSLTLFREV